MPRRQGLAAAIAAAAMLALSAGTASAAGISLIWHFSRGDGGPDTPYAGLTIDAAGRLYGTTYSGGAFGNGTVYRLAPANASHTGWIETTLYSFRGGADGAKPTGRLTLGPHGELYGTTSAGGAGHGTVFELTQAAADSANWAETVLHSFTAANGDGAAPSAGLALDEAGVLYGTTFQGGLVDAGQSGGKDGGQDAGFGTVFSLAPPDSPGAAWRETVLHRFSGAARDGVGPQSDLLLSADGALYGTTTGCGSRLACAGTVFRLARDGAGWNESVILALAGTGEFGTGPNRELTSDASGALYGTTGAGLVFRLSPQGSPTHWQQTVLERFKAEAGSDPQGGVLPGPGGTLYGTLTVGPHKSGGSVYALTPSGAGWQLSTLYRFGRRGAAFPVGGLVADASGALSGVTEIGGAGGVGTVFRIVP